MAKMTMVQALNLALRQEMEKDDRVVVLGEDVGVDGGVFRVTDGLIDQFGDQRALDTPLAESGIVGMSIGMAAYADTLNRLSGQPRIIDSLNSNLHNHLRCFKMQPGINL